LAIINSKTGSSVLSTGFTRRLEKGLPTLYWRTLLGPSYVELFGRSTLVALPIHRVEAAGESVWLQLTEETPSEESWSDFKAVRDLTISHLGRNAFAPDATLIPASMRTFDPPPWRSTAHAG
jgi:hypothetical protein